MRTLVVLLALSRVTALPAALPGASVTLPSGLGSPPLADAPTVDSPETDALAPDALAPEAPADDSPPPPPPGSELFAAEAPPPPPPPGGDGDAADLVSNLASAPPAVAPAFGRIGRGWLQQRGAAVAAAASCALGAGGAWTARARARERSSAAAAAAEAAAAERVELGDGLMTQVRALSPTRLALTTGALAAVSLLRAASTKWMADFEDLGDPPRKPGEFDDDGSDVQSSSPAEVSG